MSAGAAPRVGIVGAGRTRNGLGPFLARLCERAGARVTGVAGRDAARAAANAAALTASLGHAVAAHADVGVLCRSGIDALIVASPEEHHLAALQQALAAGIACLCEKPIVVAADVARGLEVVAAFGARGLLLDENVPWPYALPAVAALHGPAGGPPRTLRLGLSPREPGRGSMVADTLPHLLSVAHALIGDRHDFQVEAAAFPDEAPAHAGPPLPPDEACVLRVALRHDGGRLDAELHLRRCAEQPRPAWLQIDDRRIDRRIGPDYAIAFAAGARDVPVVDPMAQLVDAFVGALRRGEPGRGGGPLGIARRLHAYGRILGLLGS